MGLHSSYTLGYEVSGSDLVLSQSVQRLQNVGIRVHEGHDSDYLDAPDLVVVSSAVPDNNPEVIGQRGDKYQLLVEARYWRSLRFLSSPSR